MMRFSIYDLKIIKEANMPATILKRQISNMLQNSEICQANVLRIDPETGEYQVVL
ncbi:hypothetical protein GF337_10115 [candidate division KSB1 bacterium]|nr:hypothetical protein [candidate division KSB1 bacterium]